MKIKIRIFSLAIVFLVYCSYAEARVNSIVTSPAEKNNKIKTAFIYNFTKYVSWPNENKLKEFTICVMSSELQTQQLQSLVKFVKFRDQIPVKVIFCQNIAAIPACQVILVDAMQNPDFKSIHEKTKGNSVLIIAENLKDFKQSMISFVEMDGSMKYIINGIKTSESKIEVKKVLFDLAVQNEHNWEIIFDKLSPGTKKQSNHEADFDNILSIYKTLENDRRNHKNTNKSLEDSLRVSIERLNAKAEEFKKISTEIEKSRLSLYDQERKISKQKRLLFDQGSKITKQKTVIFVICTLSAFVLLLLLFAVRMNAQRKKAMILLSKRKSEIERQKHLVDEKQKEILDSINYAKRIQKALMANEKLMGDHLKEHFILFKPKDIVAGDFYWAARLPDAFIYVTGDSTGHGVPGAFMSLLNITKLNDAVNQKHITRPDLILNDVREGIISDLNPEGSNDECKDGMDAILCHIDFEKMKLQYAAANSNFCIIRRREILNLKADKMPVGKSNDDDIPFTFNEIALEKGDMIYTFTDGYGDQFGGPKGKKFKHKMLKEILVKISELSPETQKSMLDRQLVDWMGHLEQVDDILVIGVRV